MPVSIPESVVSATEGGENIIREVERLGEKM